MSDKHAVIWTRASGAPEKMGTLLANAKESRFSYTQEFLESSTPGLSLLTSQHLIGNRTLVRPATESMPLHPRLMALIPPNVQGNLQRRIYLDLLKRQGSLPRGFDAEWAILMLAGRNGIGHVDIFPDDLTADRYYRNQRRHPPQQVIDGRSPLWSALRDEIHQTGQLDEESTEQLAAVLGPTPSVNGMTTKLLVTIPDAPQWDGTFALPGTPTINNYPAIEVVLKIEQPGYEGVADLEDLCLSLHRELGLETPHAWRHHIDGLELLAVERFDRVQGLPLAYESLLTNFASGSQKISATSDVELPQVGQLLAKLGQVVDVNTRQVRQEFFRRFALALMTGNGDLHLDNVGLLTVKGKVYLAPVFDPAPMRAWARHDLRSAIPIAFEAGSPIYEQIAALGSDFALTRDETEEILGWAYEVTSGYADRVMALQGVPLERRERLVQVVERERVLARQFLEAHPVAQVRS